MVVWWFTSDIIHIISHNQGGAAQRFYDVRTAANEVASEIERRLDDAENEVSDHK
jgi:hypothetical protein